MANDDPASLALHRLSLGQCEGDDSGISLEPCEGDDAGIHPASQCIDAISSILNKLDGLHDVLSAKCSCKTWAAAARRVLPTRWPGLVPGHYSFATTMPEIGLHLQACVCLTGGGSITGKAWFGEHGLLSGAIRGTWSHARVELLIVSQRYADCSLELRVFKSEVSVGRRCEFGFRGTWHTSTAWVEEGVSPLTGSTTCVWVDRPSPRRGRRRRRATSSATVLDDLLDDGEDSVERLLEAEYAEEWEATTCTLRQKAPAPRPAGRRAPANANGKKHTKQSAKGHHAWA
jgi:hypothetical protein